MKKVFKVLGYLILIIVLLGVAGVAYLKLALPNVGAAPALTIDKTPARVAHGEYLANHVSVCIDCHSTRDWSQFSGPIVPGTFGKGGEVFDHRFGFPGTFYSRNITPYGLKNWTDGEIYRAITTGEDKNGEPLFPVMPYHYIGQADKEDVYDIIAYIRSLPEVASEVPHSEPDFPVSLIMRTMPHKVQHQTKPAETDTVAYGKYVVLTAGCVICHTKDEHGDPIAGLEFQGGREFMMPAGTLRSANLTPDETTGIGLWSKEAFIAKFKSYTSAGYMSPKLTPKDYNSIMPWIMYSGMKENDLAAIYKYLKTLKPVANQIVKFTPKAS